MAYIKFVERALTCKYKDSSTYEDLLRYCGNPEKAVAAGAFHLESMTTAAAEMQCLSLIHISEPTRRLCISAAVV